jgi:nitric oxide synthase-interacting protein
MTFTFSRLAFQLACDFSIDVIATSFSKHNTKNTLHQLFLSNTLIASAPPEATRQPWHTVNHPPPISSINHHTDPPGKRNTSLAFFTAHERNELKSSWGSRSTRLTRDSFLPFGSCQLCLLPSRDPVSCPSHGHLFCRECAISNLLAQSKELKRLKKEAEQRRLEDSEEKEIEDAEAQARAVEEFERVQAGLSVRSGGKIVGRKDGKVTVEQDGEKGVKRKLELDEAELKDLAEGSSKSRKKGDISSQELPAFWVPGKIPAAQKAELKAPKLHPTCPAAAADKPHDISLKSLVNVRFTEGSEAKDTANSDSSSTPTRTCPSCNKTLSNATKAVLAKPCGHVLCKPCSDKFQRAAEKSAHDKVHDEAVRCYVCQEDVTPGVAKKRDGEEKKKDKKDKVEKGLVELCSDGTGFASGGTNMVKRQGVAFQC